MNDAMKLVEKTNYLNKGIQYLKSVDISEWDMHAAGFSVLKFRKLLPEDVLNEWEKLDKHTRTVKEGMLQKSRPDIAEAILTTLKLARLSCMPIILRKIRSSPSRKTRYS